VRNKLLRVFAQPKNFISCFTLQNLLVLGGLLLLLMADRSVSVFVQFSLIVLQRIVEHVELSSDLCCVAFYHMMVLQL